jgi:hypothetical protein
VTTGLCYSTSVMSFVGAYQSLSMSWPTNTLQPTGRERRGRSCRVPCAGLSSLGHSA